MVRFLSQTRISKNFNNKINNFILRAIILFCSVFCFYHIANAATYYIDYQNGNDTFDGMSKSTPFRHCPGDPAATGSAASVGLQPGDEVLFKRGVAYKGAITAQWSGNILAHQSISTGGASITSNGLLTDSDGNFVAAGIKPGQYIYIYWSKRQNCTGWTCQQNSWVNSCGVFKIASVDSPTQITLEGFHGAAHLVPEMTYGIINPITFKSSPDWGSGEAIIDGEGARTHLITAKRQKGLRIESLTFTNTSDAGDTYDAAIYYGNWIQVVNCKFTNIGASSSNVRDYSVMSNCETTTAKYLAFGIFNDYCLIENNKSSGPSTRSVMGHRCNIIRYNYIKDTTLNWVSHSDGIGFLDGGANGDSHYGWIYGNTIDNSVEFIALYAPAGGPKYWIVHSNVFIGRRDQTGDGDAGILMRGVSYIKIFNNTFFGVGGGGFINGIRMSDGDGFSCSNIEIKNNIFYMYANNALAIAIYPGNDQNIIVDYNHYYILGDQAFYFGGAHKTFAEWHSLGYDQHGISTLTEDPLFNSVANINLHLTNKSPDLNAGENLSSYFNNDASGTFNRPSNGNFSLGAFEGMSSTIGVPSDPNKLRIDKLQ